MALTGYPKEFRSMRIHSVQHASASTDGSAAVGDVLAGDNTYFMIKVHGNVVSQSVIAKVKHKTGGIEETVEIFVGESFDGPFAQVEIASVGDVNTTALIYYQEI
tara:strand:+ start:412 stop:726 length:315 start_codon:yes stop_codon:yes gene_type:complete